MRERSNYIGINQRIQFEVLDSGIHDFLLNGKVSKELFMNHIREFTKGENRVEKEASYIMLIFKRQQEILHWIQSKCNAEQYLLISKQGRQAIALCLVSLTFPITYDLLNVLGGVFKVQQSINKQSIVQKMSLNYGSNRSLFNAMDALLQMFIEQEAIQRVKIGLYSFGSKKIIISPFTTELLIYTDIKLSLSKSILVDDISHRSWYSFFQLKINKELKFELVRLSDSMIGQGYLTLIQK